MSKITAVSLQTKNKNRVNIYLDGEFFAGVSLETVMGLRLKVGMDIDEKDIRNLLGLSERSEALNKAVGYISKTPKTKRQVKEYLLKKGYSDKVVYCVIDKLSDYNYIDDIAYAAKYIENYKNSQGKHLIEYKLMMKGVCKSDIEAAYGDNVFSQKDEAFMLAEKHLKNKEPTKENFSKTFRYLIGKGFSYEDAEQALSKLRGRNDGEDFNG